MLEEINEAISKQVGDVISASAESTLAGYDEQELKQAIDTAEEVADELESWMLRIEGAINRLKSKTQN